uniref:Fibrillin 1 n=1 Tax=Timema bartmani TaxID=61472 RepID=A0A7R9ESF4_9NEOP|nr:unnamed protein product [Timema bartmani]
MTYKTNKQNTVLYLNNFYSSITKFPIPWLLLQVLQRYLYDMFRWHHPQCICPMGTQLSPISQVCEDINECQELGEEACVNGDCINTLGSYECECEAGFILDNTGRICIGLFRCILFAMLVPDNRKGSCWTRLVGGRCENNLPRLTLKSECCCSVGLAWGSPCEICNQHLCDCPKGYAKARAQFFISTC